MPWCHTVVHFELQMTVFEPYFRMIILTVEANLHSKRFFIRSHFQCVTQD